MIDAKQTKEHIARIAELEREAQGLLDARAEVIERMNAIYHEAALRYAADYSTNVALEARIWQDLRADGEYPALMQRLREVDARRADINIAVEARRPGRIDPACISEGERGALR